jgi:hypothetical protein
VTATLEMRIAVSGREQAAQDFGATRAAAEAASKGVAAATSASTRAQDAFAGATSRSRLATEQGTQATNRAKTALGQYTSETLAASRANTQFAATARSQMGAMDGLQQSVSGLRTLYGSVAAIAGGMLVRSFIDAGSEVEDLTVQFKVLLGSVDAAKERIEEYSEFGATTPFELGEIASAGRVLQVFGGDLLATGENLRMVGDIAYGTNVPFQDTAMWIGRMYDSLQSGRPWGEAAARLQEMGALSGRARAELESMEKSGQSGTAVWARFTAEMAKFEGMMAEGSNTVSGKWSTTLDLIKQGMRDILAGGAWDTLNKGLGDFNAMLTQLISSGALREVGENLSMLMIVLRDLAVVWGANKIITNVNLYVTALRAQSVAASEAAVANRAYNGSLGLIGAAAVAASIGVDALIEHLDKLATRKGNTAWRDDAVQLKKVRDAMLDYAEAAETASASSYQFAGAYGQGSQANAAAVKKQQDANDVLRSITGWDYDDLVNAQKFTTEIANVRLRALNASKRNVATEDILGMFGAPSASSEMTEEALAAAEKMQTAVEAANAKFRAANRKAAQEDAAIDEEYVEKYRAAQLRLAEASISPEDKIASLRLKQEEELALYQEGSEARLMIAAAHAKEMARLEEEESERRGKNSDEYRAYTSAVAQMNAQMQASSFALANSMVSAMFQSRKSAVILFATQKAIAAASIISSSLAAQSAAYAPPPIGAGPILGVTLDAKLKTKMFTDLAFLAATSIAEGAQKFADGGIANSGIVQGSAYFGDTVNARLNSREMVLNMGQQAQLFAYANGAAPTSNSRVTNNYDITWSPVMPQSMMRTPDPTWEQVRRVLEYNKVEFAGMLGEMIKKGY